jgi:hypothetical protein
MFGIGDFARHGRVSVRMLRHYDAIGLLRPRRAQLQSQIATDATIQTVAAWIDANGYRSAGYGRERYIEYGEDRDTWVTELQEPIATG